MRPEDEKLEPACSRSECFACGKTNSCLILQDTDFKGHDCPFYKTKETYKIDRERADRRLLALGRKKA